MALFGELLVQKNIITKEQLNSALQSQKNGAGLALGDIIIRDFSVPQEKVEIIFANKILIPFLKTWLMRTFKEKLQIKGVDLSLFITGLDINISVFSRTTSKQVTFNRDIDGHFIPSSEDRTDELVNAVIDTMSIRTIRKQNITFTNIGVTVNLFTKNLTLNDGAGFISEARIRLMQAVKQKN
jgi:hypothetical protein